MKKLREVKKSIWYMCVWEESIDIWGNVEFNDTNFMSYLNGQTLTIQDFFSFFMLSQQY
jgi:hypothetical protein